MTVRSERRAKVRSRQRRAESGRPSLLAAGTGAEAPPETETEWLRRARESIGRIGPELRRLERLRDLAESRRSQGGPSPGALPAEEENLLNALARILAHGIQGIEEGWFELHECFSDRGLARLRNKVKAGSAARPAREPERGEPKSR